MYFKYLFTFVFVIRLFFSAFSQEEENNIEFSAYYENQFFPQKSNNGEISLQDYNKLRLNISSEISDKISFKSNYILKTYHGKTTINIMEFMPEYLRQENISDYEIKLENESFLDNAYISIYTKRLNFRIGKQQLSMGSAYAWNPTDIFNRKNTMDPTYEKIGLNAFKIEFPFHNDAMLTGILNVNEEFKNSTKGIKLKEHFFGFDFSLSFIEKEEIDTSKRTNYGFNFSGEVLGFGVHGEFAYNEKNNSKNFKQFVFGADYTFENSLYFIAEYYKNELGKTDYKKYSFFDWTRFFTEGENLGQDYIYLGESYPIGDFLNWSNFLMLNLNDKSGVFFPWFDLSINDNTEFIIVAYLPFGKKNTEFGEFGKGAFARIKVYF